MTIPESMEELENTDLFLFERRTTLESQLKNGGIQEAELVFIHGLGHSTFRGTTESRQRSSFEGSSSSARDVCWRAA